MERSGEGDKAPEQSKVELESKVWTKSSTLAEGKIAVVPSEDTKGKTEEETKFKLTFLQNVRKDEESIISSHFLQRK